MGKVKCGIIGSVGIIGAIGIFKTAHEIKKFRKQCKGRGVVGQGFISSNSNPNSQDDPADSEDSDSSFRVFSNDEELMKFEMGEDE